MQIIIGGKTHLTYTCMTHHRGPYNLLGIISWEWRNFPFACIVAVGKRSCHILILRIVHATLQPQKYLYRWNAICVATSILPRRPRNTVCGRLAWLQETIKD
jgi:hypothetical protein